MANFEKGKHRSESESLPFGDIAKSEQPYEDASKIFTHILVKNDPTPARLHFFRDISALYEAFDNRAMYPEREDHLVPNQRRIVAQRTIDHNREEVRGYKDEEKEWTNYLGRILDAAIAFERKLDKSYVVAYEIAIPEVGGLLKKCVDEADRRRGLSVPEAQSPQEDVKPSPRPKFTLIKNTKDK